MFLHPCVSHSVHGRRGQRGMCGSEGVHVCAGETATEAGGTHPTGMYSCF